MKNKTVEWIATLRDDMTTKWNVMSNNIAGRTRQLAGAVSRNWLSTGAAIAGAFYLAVRALEKVEKIAKKVDRAVEGAGGQSANAARQVQQLGAQVENIKKLVNEVIVRGGLMALGIGKSVAVFFATLYTVILTRLALIEQGLNALGITSSKTLQGLRDQGVKKMQEFSKGAMDAFSASLAASEKLGIGIESLKEKVDRLKKELEATDPGTKAYVQKLKEWDTANRQLEVSIMQAQVALARSIPQSHIDKVAQLKAQLEELGKTSGQKFFEKMTEDMRHFDAQAKRVMDITIKDLKKAFGADKETPAGLDDQVAIQGELTAFEQTRQTEMEILQQWYDRAVEMANENEFLITDIKKVYAQQRADIELEKTKQTWEKVGQIATQVMGLIMQASAQASQARIDDIEGERDAKLQAIDEQLDKETLTEEQRNVLLDKRKALENEYNNQLRAEKKRAFEAEKAANIIMAVINTAQAVAKALASTANPIWAYIIGALGAVQIGIIASQPTPRFKRGTPPGGFIVPSGFEDDGFQMRVSSGERVQVTPAGEEARRGGNTVIINFNSPVPSGQWVVDSVKKVLRETNLTVDKLLVNDRYRVTLP